MKTPDRPVQDEWTLILGNSLVWPMTASATVMMTGGPWLAMTDGRRRLMTVATIRETSVDPRRWMSGLTSTVVMIGLTAAKTSNGEVTTAHVTGLFNVDLKKILLSCFSASILL